MSSRPQSGDDAIICQGPASAAVALQACGELARRAHAAGEKFIPPGPDGQLAREMAGALQPVGTARAKVHSLGGEPPARAETAAGVAQAELEAVKALKELAKPPRYGSAWTASRPRSSTKKQSSQR